MTRPTYLESKLKEYEHHPAMVTQRAMLALVRHIMDRMEALGMTRSQLAAKSGLQPAQITRILGGEHNLTMQTIGRVMTALETDFSIRLSPFDAKRKPSIARKKKPATQSQGAPRAPSR